MADQHEFLLTPGNSAIIVAYAEKTINANAYRPSGDTVDRRHQVAFDCIIQEINLDTAQVVLRVAQPQARQPGPEPPALAGRLGTPGNASTPWDYFHINAVQASTPTTT